MGKHCVIIAVVLAVAAPARADRYTGPDQPELTADKDPISVAPADCKKDVLEAWGADDDTAKQYAKSVCSLRKKHLAARAKLKADLAAIVARYKGQTNHDHDQRLSTTIQSIDTMVKSCLAALDSQQYCHNVQCLEQPEDNAILCETQASAVAEQI